MTGPWPHPKTGILYYRKATPPDIWRARSKLAALGIKVTREVHRSLETREHSRQATDRYHEIAADQAAIWTRWRDALAHGPTRLTHKQVVALATEKWGDFLERHEDDPFDAPAASEMVLSDEGEAQWVAALKAMGPEERRGFLTDFKQVLQAEDGQKISLFLGLAGKYPSWGNAAARGFAASLEATHGTDADGAFANHGVTASRNSRRHLAIEMMFAESAARRGLGRRQRGDYGPVEEFANAPAFQPIAKSAALKSAGLSLYALLADKDSRRNRAARHSDKDKSIIAKFVAFVGHDDARKLTKADVRGWRDAMIEEGLDPKTINDKRLAVLKAVLNHGMREKDLPENVAMVEQDARPSPPKGRKEYRPDEALAILRATFSVRPAEGLKPCYKRAAFWAPWIMAYTGLRVTEVTQLRGSSLIDGDHPHLLITPDHGSTKSADGGGKAWHVGIHRHVIELGLLTLMRRFGDAPIFYDGVDDDVPITDPTEMIGRAQEAATKVTEWVKGAAPPNPPIQRLNHAWRHLHTTRCRQGGLDKEARDHMMGSGPQDAREGYGMFTPDVLDREINKLARFGVVDTGYRPE